MLSLAPIPGGDNDVPLDSLRALRFGVRKLTRGDAVGPVAKIFERHAAKIARERVDHHFGSLAGLDAPHPCLFAGFEGAE